MLNHAAWKSSKKFKQSSPTEPEPDVDISSMDSKQMADYYSRWD